METGTLPILIALFVVIFLAGLRTWELLNNPELLAWPRIITHCRACGNPVYIWQGHKEKTYLVVDNPNELAIPGSFRETVHSNCGKVSVVKVHVQLVQKLN